MDVNCMNFSPGLVPIIYYKLIYTSCSLHSSNVFNDFRKCYWVVNNLSNETIVNAYSVRNWYLIYFQLRNYTRCTERVICCLAVLVTVDD